MQRTPNWERGIIGSLSILGKYAVAVAVAVVAVAVVVVVVDDFFWTCANAIFADDF